MGRRLGSARLYNQLHLSKRGVKTHRRPTKPVPTAQRRSTLLPKTSQVHGEPHMVKRRVPPSS